MSTKVLSSSSLSGTEVKNLQGENIGKIKDVMIDWQTGTVAYAVLTFGGTMGFGSKLFAIPLEAFNFNYQQDSDPHVVLNLDKERLENAPGFEDNHWPDHADNTFLDSIYSHYGYGTYRKDL